MTDAKEPESVRALRRIREMKADVDAWVEWGEDGQLLEAYPGELLDHITTLTRERDALTMHMNQVHDTLGGTDTVLTLEAAQHVVFERDTLKTQLAAARVENDTQRRAMNFWENYAMPHELPFLHRLRALAPEQQDALLRFGQTLKAMTITAALSEATP